MSSRSRRSAARARPHNPDEAAMPVCYWRCPNCGQVHFGDSPPDTCDFCRDFTTWQPIEAQPAPPRRHRDPPPMYVQLRLPLNFEE